MKKKNGLSLKMYLIIMIINKRKDMKKICKNCDFYLGDNNCSCKKFELGYHNSDDFLKENKDCVKVENDEGWGFYVGEEFGCIHFENEKDFEESDDYKEGYRAGYEDGYDD